MIVIKESQNTAVDLAAKALLNGKLISFKTDTIYGIAADATNHNAIDNLYKIKNRDQKKSIAIFLKDLNAARKIFCFNKKTKDFINQFSTEGFTFVLRLKKNITKPKLASNINNSDDFMGFRIVNTEFVKNLLEKFDRPIAVTSANISGFVPCDSLAKIRKTFSKDQINLFLDAGKCKNKIPSTVVKITDDEVIVIRDGIRKIDKKI